MVVGPCIMHQFTANEADHHWSAIRLSKSRVYLFVPNESFQVSLAIWILFWYFVGCHLVPIRLESIAWQLRMDPLPPELRLLSVAGMDTSLRSLFSQFPEHGSPAPRQLTHLQLLLDDECLRHSSSETSSFQSTDDTPDLIRQIAEYLSGSLSQVENLESSGNRIQQLRALVASLALLHHLKVTIIHPRSYDKLRQNILHRYSEIKNGSQPSKATPEQTIRHETNLYLIKLVAQYFSLFRRSEPWHEALIAPVLGLVLTGASIVGNSRNSIHV